MKKELLMTILIILLLILLIINILILNKLNHIIENPLLVRVVS